MTVITNGSAPRVVTVRQATSVATVRVAPRTVEVIDAQRPAVVEQVSHTVEVGMVGVQGPRGLPGDAAGAETRVAAAVLGAHRAVVALADGRVVYGEPDALTGPVIGLTLTSAVLGGDTTLQSAGRFVVPGASFTAGAPVFLGPTGTLTQVAPTAGAIVELGEAEGADTLYLRIEPPIFY